MSCGQPEGTIYVTNPEDCTKFDRTKGQLEEWAIFCTCVAGKNARTVQGCLQYFWIEVMQAAGYWMSPFELIKRLTHNQRRWRWVAYRLKRAGIGCHTMKSKAIIDLAYEIYDTYGLGLEHATIEQLEGIRGWGPKTARYFALHSRKNQRCVPLDTHVLKYLSARGVPDVPKSTPPAGKQYKKFEDHFLFFYDTMADKAEFPTVADFDLAIWNLYSKRKRS